MNNKTEERKFINSKYIHLEKESGGYVMEITLEDMQLWLREFSAQKTKALTDKVAGLEKEKRILNDKIEHNYKIEIDALRREKTELKSELSQQKELVEEIKKEKDRYQFLFEDYSTELDNTKEDYKKSLDVIEKEIGKRVDCEHEIEALKKELDVYKQNLEWRKGQIESQSLRIKELEEGMKGAIATCDFYSGDDILGNQYKEIFKGISQDLKTLSAPTTEPKEEKEGGEDE